jgi:hypothetical protein
MSTKITLLASAILLNLASVQAQDTVKVLSVNDSIVQSDSLPLEAVLTTGDGVLHATLERVIGDSLVIIQRDLVQSIFINSIWSITVHTTTTGTWIGAGIGVVVGGLSGASYADATHEEPTRNPNSFTIDLSGLRKTVAIGIGAIIGGVFGGVVVSKMRDVDKIDGVYDLSSITLPEKVKLIQFLLERKSQNR